MLSRRVPAAFAFRLQLIEHRRHPRPPLAAHATRFAARATHGLLLHAPRRLRRQHMLAHERDQPPAQRSRSNAGENDGGAENSGRRATSRASIVLTVAILRPRRQVNDRAWTNTNIIRSVNKGADEEDAARRRRASDSGHAIERIAAKTQFSVPRAASTPQRDLVERRPVRGADRPVLAHVAAARGELGHDGGAGGERARRAVVGALAEGEDAARPLGAAARSATTVSTKGATRSLSHTHSAASTTSASRGSAPCDAASCAGSSTARCQSSGAAAAEPSPTRAHGAPPPAASPSAFAARFGASISLTTAGTSVISTSAPATAAHSPSSPVPRRARRRARRAIRADPRFRIGQRLDQRPAALPHHHPGRRGDAS